MNLCYGRNYTDSEAAYVTEGIGNTYLKAQYVGYTDDTFSKKSVRGLAPAVPSSTANTFTPPLTVLALGLGRLSSAVEQLRCRILFSANPVMLQLDAF